MHSAFEYCHSNRECKRRSLPRVYSAAVIGTIASVAPTLGPVIGGWITDTWNWHWLFYVNLLPGVAITIPAGWAN